MAIPAIAGLAWIGGLLGGLLKSSFAFTVGNMAKKLASLGVAISMLVIITAVFFAAVATAINTLVPVMPSYVSQGMGLLFPSNWAVCLSTLMGVKALRWAYEWHVKLIHMKVDLA